MIRGGVYLTNPATGKTFEFKTQKVIQSLAQLLQLHPPNAQNEIVLDNCVYMFDVQGAVGNLTGYTLAYTGYPIAIVGMSQAITTIFTTEDGVSFIKSTNGDLFLANINLGATGVGSQAIEMIGNGNQSIDMFYTAFTTGTKYGTLSNIRQGYWSNGFSFNAREGFLLQSAFGGFTLFDSRIINTGNYIIKGDVGATFDAIRSNVNATIPASSVAFDFDYGMFNADAAYQIQDGRFDGDGQVAADFTTGDTAQAHKSRKSLFKDNAGVLGAIVNTVIGGNWRLGAEVETPLTLNTPAKLLGTVTYNDLEHFTQSGDNTLTYNSTVNRTVKVTGALIIDGGANDEIVIILRKWDASASAYVDIEEFPNIISNVIGGRDIALYNIIARVSDMELGDRLEYWIENRSDNTNATALVGAKMFVEKL
jgi:hypothetical protein